MCIYIYIYIHTVTIIMIMFIVICGCCPGWVSDQVGSSVSVVDPQPSMWIYDPDAEALSPASRQCSQHHLESSTASNGIGISKEIGN